MTKKLQNSFNVFLPQNYGDFKLAIPTLTSNQGTVASLLRICCDGDDVKAIKIAFERIIGKPEKVLIIKRTMVRTVFPDAKKKFLKPAEALVAEDETQALSVTDKKVVLDEVDTPGYLLKRELDKIGETSSTYAYEILDNRNNYSVVEVMIANLYAIAQRGTNIGAIAMLFDYLDGAVADVVRIEGEDTVMLENYADIAPYEAIMGDDGIYYLEVTAVK